MMRYSSVARAVVLACPFFATALQVQAQTTDGATLYGIVDAGLYSRQFAGEARMSRVDSGLLSTSRWGLRGNEDLGDGYVASFDLTSHFRADTGEAGRHAGDTAAGRFFTLASWVALRGAPGTIRLGRMPTGAFAQTVQFTPFGDSAALSPFLLHTFVSTQPMQVSHGGSDGMWNNSVAYISPNFRGFTAQVIAAPSEGPTAGKRVEVTFNYRVGPLAAALTHSDIKGAAMTSPRVASDPAGPPYTIETERSALASLSYDFTSFKLFGQYATARLQPKGLAALNLDTMGLSAEVPTGGLGRAIASWARTTREQSGVSDRQRNTLSVGYVYSLSKRSDLYGVVIADRVTTLESGTGAAMGLRHRF